ncbi:hypothetical protein [Streptomyces filamentosus]|uniref:hypothetical protein n=1 Tax=Streptomyces filamentosus TaxID=67294 RepID=UPI00123C75B5|nr:hypothetical protein [Streptomyces filamentosus]
MSEPIARTSPTTAASRPLRRTPPPTLYRYAVADPASASPATATQPFSAVTIGLALIVGRHAYCVKWAHGRVRFV